MSKNENRLNFRMTDETAAKIERWYQEDNCRSKNEFIEKAVNCYADMLAAGESTTLPRAVQSAIDSRLKLFEDRIGQTKVCIENKTDARNPIYSFFAFKDMDGNSSVILPSIVQLNKDNSSRFMVPAFSSTVL